MSDLFYGGIGDYSFCLERLINAAAVVRSHEPWDAITAAANCLPCTLVERISEKQSITYSRARRSCFLRNIQRINAIFCLSSFAISLTFLSSASWDA